MTDHGEEVPPWADYIAARFHEAYERLAPDFGYDTRPESAVPWEDVPEANRLLMRAVVADVFDHSGWSGHDTPDGRFAQVHDKNSVHMDGCVPLYRVRQSGR